MLTPEQIRLRIRDNEMRELKQQNIELKDRLDAAKKAMAGMMRELARHATWRVAAEYNKLAADLEAQG